MSKDMVKRYTVVVDKDLTKSICASSIVYDNGYLVFYLGSVIHAFAPGEWLTVNLYSEAES